MTMILNKIGDPSDVAQLSADERVLLAAELRKEIINGVSKCGGHLASNLGVIELTIALLIKYNFLEDRIVWDVGHQCYAYKLMTGRRSNFHTLRKKDGLSGFPKRSESPYDAFDTGHSSTSISAALGILRAKELAKEKGRVIAVIGDGALTGGMAYEALNDAGHFGERLIVILNDNQMSINGNVGAVSKRLTKLRITTSYLRAKNLTEKALRKTPLIGKRIMRMISVIKEAIRTAVRKDYPVIFEDLGFAYYGPIDGHNIDSLLQCFEIADNVNQPILLHVVTQKGKGYDFAECAPTQYHGVAPFNVELGCDGPEASSFTQAFGEALVDIAARDDRVVAVCAAMRTSTGLDMFYERYKRRFYDVGIAEAHAVTMAAGMASHGFVPVVALYSTFLQRAYDQILHDVCLQNLRVVFALDRAGIVGADGETHQGLFDMAMLQPMPNMEILAPRDYDELRIMLSYAVELALGPVAIRYPRATNIDLGHFDAISIVNAQVLREGADLTIFSVGFMAVQAFEAADILQEQGIECEVVDLRRVKPLDETTLLLSAKKTRAWISIEDGVISGGVGERLLHLFEQNNVHRPFALLGTKDRIVPAGSRKQLLEREKMNAPALVAAACAMVKKPTPLSKRK